MSVADVFLQRCWLCGCNLPFPHFCRSQGGGCRERGGEKRKTFSATPPSPQKHLSHPPAISQPPVSMPAIPKYPLPLPPHQLCVVDAFQRLDSATECCCSVQQRAAFHRRCLGRRGRAVGGGGGWEEERDPGCFAALSAWRRVSPLDKHPRENRPFNAERHLLQPFFFFLFRLLL